MALELRNGILTNNDDDWVDYYVLDDLERGVYRVWYDKRFRVTLVNKPSSNPEITDTVTGIKCQLAITAQGQLYIKVSKKSTTKKWLAVC